MFDWNNLPSNSEITAAIRNIFETVGNSPSPTLYQFSLNVLDAIYHWLEPSVCKPVPAPRSSEGQSSLRAIAYFSWEKERHTFLIRRVYPVSFDFLSYSHVPDGWGALGVMRDEHANEDYKGHTTIANIKESILLLPYLRESERLEYESVLVVPVVNDGLKGAFVFYLRNKEALPTTAQESLLVPKFNTLASEMGKAVSEHLVIIGEGIGSLPELWRANSPAAKDEGILELKIWIKPAAISGESDLDRVFDDMAGSILSALNTEETFTILDNSKESPQPNMIIFLVIGKIPLSILKRQILSAVGVAIGDSCPKNENRYFRFTCNPVEAN